MNQDIIALITAGLLFTLGYFNKELIKSFVSKITGGKNNSLYSFITIIVISISISFTSYYIPITEEEINTEVTQAPQKTEIETYVEVAEDVLDIASEIHNNVKENKLIKDSIYEATREKRWVYQIGEIVSDKDLLIETFNSVKDLGNVNAYETPKGKFLLFIDKHWEENILLDSIDKFKAGISDQSIKVIVIDLCVDCKKKEQIIVKDEIKIGKKKKKQILTCYSCGK